MNGGGSFSCALVLFRFYEILESMEYKTEIFLSTTRYGKHEMSSEKLEECGLLNVTTAQYFGSFFIDDV